MEISSRPQSRSEQPLACSRSLGFTGAQARWRWHMPPVYLLFAWTLATLMTGGVCWMADRPDLADLVWMSGTVPVVVFLAITMIRTFIEGRVGVDAIAFVSMTAALLLSQSLAAIVVAIMYAGGNVLETYAVGRAERDLSALRQRAPVKAHRIRGETINEIAVEDVVAGDRLLVRSGEIVPVDGVILSPEGELDEAAMTGEALPLKRRKGETARSGTLNAGGALEIRAVATADESSYAGLLRLVDAAREDRAPFVRMADRFAIYLLPFTLAVAAAAWWVSGDPLRGLAVLVVATPCPLILAAPVAFVSGISRTARRGVLLRGGRVIEALAEIRIAVFDKTGTLTQGGARLIGVESSGKMDGDTILALAASLEQASHHALAAAIVEAATRRDIPLSIPSEVKETHGVGLEGIVSGRRVTVGAANLVGCSPDRPWARRALRLAMDRGALPIGVAVDGEAIGMLLVADPVRPEAAGTLRSMRTLGIERFVMLTGDRKEAAELIAAGLPLDAVLADCTPEQKLHVLHEEAIRGPVLMVGDGINDAPALAAAHVGLAIGARGGSAASQAADAVLLVEAIDRIPAAIRIAQRTRAIARQSVMAGLALSFAAMVAASFGYLPPVAGALTQEAIDVAVILNALRALGPAVAWKSAAEHEDRRRVLSEHKVVADAIRRLEEISDRLDDAAGEQTPLVNEALDLIRRDVLTHERRDDRERFAERLAVRRPRAVLTALGYAHGEIFSLARRLEEMGAASPEDRFRPLRSRAVQRLIDELILWLRLHNAIEDALSVED